MNFSFYESNIVAGDYLICCNTLFFHLLFSALYVSFQAAGKCFLMSAPTANNHPWFSAKKEVSGQQGVAYSAHQYNRPTHHSGPPTDVSIFV